jgi:hypothetical protein
MDFTPDERQVFPYFDGVANVWGDPLDIHDKLTDLLDGDPASVVEHAKSLDPRTRYDAKRKLDKAVITAFEMPPFDKTTGAGSTRVHRTVALNTWCAWMETHKKKADVTPTSSPSTAVPCPPCAAAAEAAMNATSASGSTLHG